MCWSVRVSLAVAAYGYAASAYLWHRSLPRDRWYATFLATFTSTQIFDAFFWAIQEEAADLPCSSVTLETLAGLDAGALNNLLSRWVLPPVLWMQLIILSMFPSSAAMPWRQPYRALVVVLCSATMHANGCTKLWAGHTLLWGGWLPRQRHVAGLLSVGAFGTVMFVRPHAVWAGILVVGGLNLGLLQVLDGTVALMSKLCCWCVLLSFFFISEPLWLNVNAERKGGSASWIRALTLVVEAAVVVLVVCFLSRQLTAHSQ